jgi:hypothetical protein
MLCMIRYIVFHFIVGGRQWQVKIGETETITKMRCAPIFRAFVSFLISAKRNYYLTLKSVCIWTEIAVNEESSSSLFIQQPHFIYYMHIIMWYVRLLYTIYTHTQHNSGESASARIREKSVLIEVSRTKAEILPFQQIFFPVSFTIRRPRIGRQSGNCSACNIYTK